ncbi:MAG: maleylpyruvate isomerase N-terminal domain-containing protein [Chloroflexi bacterium]|nr:maleylpyruvate isomerase N-terminal domain-containing protein [Chloroflexota bacterium]
MTLVTGERREAFLADEKDARATWDAAVAAVPVTAVADRVLADDRSVKDLVAHIAAWERWAEERLAARIEGRAPVRIPDWHAFEHDFNARAHARWRDEPWDAVAAEAAAAYAAFRERVEQLDDEQLARAEELIKGCGSRHYAEYVGQLRDLVDRLSPPR